LNDTALSLSNDWIDEDDTPEFSDDDLENLPVTFRRNGQVIAKANGLSALREKLHGLENAFYFKQRTQQHRQQIAQMRQLERMGMAV
jgi:hypothetical protein